MKEYLTNYRMNFDENQISAFSIDKADKDFESIMRIVNNKEINQNEKIERALIDYRLQALLIYRLLGALDRGIDINEVKQYYKRYFAYIQKVTFNNGLRSIKLNWSRLQLLVKMR